MIKEHKEFKYELEHIFSYSVGIHWPLEVIGETPVGLRMNTYIAGGEVWGPRVRGRVLPVGADWLTIRLDGIGMLDVRGTIETHDGALLYVSYTGVMELGPDGYQQILAGVSPGKVAQQTASRILTSHPDYLWLNRLQCLNFGMSDFETKTVTYDVYAVKSDVN